jgi:hypothetical protein
MNAITFGNHGTNKRCQIRRPTISPLSYFAPSIALHQYQIALHHSGYIIPSLKQEDSPDFRLYGCRGNFATASVLHLQTKCGSKKMKNKTAYAHPSSS